MSRWKGHFGGMTLGIFLHAADQHSDWPATDVRIFPATHSPFYFEESYCGTTMVAFDWQCMTSY